jgi:hypothetical protein
MKTSFHSLEPNIYQSKIITRVKSNLNDAVPFTWSENCGSCSDLQTNSGEMLHLNRFEIDANTSENQLWLTGSGGFGGGRVAAPPGFANAACSRVR